MNFFFYLENVSKMNREELLVIEIKMCLFRWVYGLDEYCYKNYFWGKDF